MKDLKEKLITIFTTLYHFHSTLGTRGNIATKYRVSSYAKILSILQKIETPIYSSKDLKDIPNIGKSTFEKIDIIQHTGTHPLYEEVIKNKEYQILMEFQKIRGIGPEKAYQIYKDGYRNIKSLKKDILEEKYKIDTHIKVSLLYMDDLNKKIPHNDITLFTNYLKEKYKLNIINSGSYRMEKTYSGDIDLLCIVKDGKRNSESKQIMKMLKMENPSLCKHIYNESSKKINAIIENPITGKVHQMDMLFVYKKEVPWMLLYFGSGKEFSKKIRAYAIQKGYKLNEKGLYDIKSGKRVNFHPKSEKEIFDFLDYPYILARNR
jgi:DNA polymerase (family 10)